MANTRLEIGTDTNVGVFNEIPITIDFQIADVRQPENRKGSMSKTINIPGSQDVNILFENIFEVNISLQTFNPGIKTDAAYYVDEILQISGYLQLLKVLVNETTGQVSYECSLIGEMTSFFTDINGLFLTNIDFTNYDTGVGVVNYTHNLTAANIANSWATTPGVSYVYPMIDWGTHNNNFNFAYPTDFRGCFFARAYLYAIFNMAGYSWTSVFLDSTFFKRLIIPPTELPALSTAVMNNNKFRAGIVTPQAAVTYTTIFAYPTVLQTSNVLTTVIFDDDSTTASGYYDPGGIYNNATAVFTIPVTNAYNRNVNIGFDIKVFRDIGAGYVDVSNLITGVSGTLNVYGCGGSSQINIVNVVFTGSNFTSITNTNVNLVAAATDKITWDMNGVVVQTSSATAGTYQFRVQPVVTSNYAGEFSSASEIGRAHV
jgi:hypothetical protein